MADVKPPVATVTTPTTPAPAAVAAPLFTAEQNAYIQQLIIATAVALQQNTQQQMAPIRKPQVAPEQCIVCRQALSACQGKHTKMVVFPTKYPEYSTYFLGVKINGVVYFSYDENYTIEVPDCCVSTIINAINAFEQNEKTIGQSRNKTHNSGSIGKHGKGFVKAEAAWR